MTSKRLSCSFGLTLAFAFVVAPTPCRAAIPASERAALIQLYNSTNGAGWTDRTNWRNATDTDFADPGTECTWFGVSCTAGDAAVRSLMLVSNHLTGSLPASIGDFASLEYLWLWSNELTGPIPDSVGNLSHLKDISIYSNQLTGSLPSTLGNLGALERLWVFQNQLSGPIPPGIGNLPNLQVFTANANQLSGPVPSFAGAPKLTHLYANTNQLTGGIPASLGQIPTLAHLDLSYNPLGGTIPPELGGLSNLEVVSFNSCNLSGPIPGSLGNLTKVTNLSLESNHLSGTVPSALGSMPALRQLNLQRNDLTGSLPQTLASLPSLSGLHLGYNSFDGPVPSWLGSIPTLTYLRLENNAFSGRIPSELGSLTALESLFLQGNRLSGPVPTNLANLTNLIGGGLGLIYNGVYTNDAALRTFLDSHQNGWSALQTIAPAGLAASLLTQTGFTASWTPITFTSFSGGYRVLASTLPGGPYSLVATTAAKTDASAVAVGLTPGTTYSVVVESFTSPHDGNANTVTSEPSGEVTITTAAGAGTFRAIDVTLAGSGSGRVTSSPAGLDCGGICRGSFADGSAVTLTAEAADGSGFVGWGGACSGTSVTCQLSMDTARAVSATFVPATALYALTPCRLFDSRSAGAGVPLAAGSQTIVPATGHCGIPSTATSVALNVTVTAPTAAGFVRVFPSGTALPTTSVVNYAAGRTRANNTIVMLGSSGAVDVQVSQSVGTAHVVVDVSGYFQ